MRATSAAVISFLFISTISQPALAAAKQDAKLKAAFALFNAAHENEIENTKIDILVKQSADWFQQTNPGTTDADLRLFRFALRRELRRYSGQMLLMRARYYTSHFTVQELQYWTSDLRTKIGQKIVLATPSIMRDLYAADLVWHKLAIDRAVAEVRQAIIAKASRS